MPCFRFFSTIKILIRSPHSHRNCAFAVRIQSVSWCVCGSCGTRMCCALSNLLTCILYKNEPKTWSTAQRKHRLRCDWGTTSWLNSFWFRIPNSMFGGIFNALHCMYNFWFPRKDNSKKKKTDWNKRKKKRAKAFPNSYHLKNSYIPVGNFLSNFARPITHFCLSLICKCYKAVSFTDHKIIVLHLLGNRSGVEQYMG